MAIKVDLSKWKELIEIQKERKLAMDVLSEQLGIDISFSDEEVMKFAEEAYAKDEQEDEAWDEDANAEVEKDEEENTKVRTRRSYQRQCKAGVTA